MKRLACLVVIAAALAMARPAYAQSETPTPSPTVTQTPGPTPTQTLIPDPDISDNLVSCWTLDEESGTRYDMYGANDLSDNNTVGSVAGVLDGAAYFQNANSEQLTHISNGDLYPGGPFTISGWFKRNSADNYNVLLSKPSDLEVSFYYNQFGFSYGTNLNGSILSDTSNWHFFYVIFDGTYQYMRLDNGQEYQQASGGDAGNDGSSFSIGGLPAYSNTYWWNGNIDEVAYWKRAVSNDERAWLYNYGSGRNCELIAEVPTSTPTPTITPTPGNAMDVPLSSGDWMTIQRQFSYGEISVVLSVMAGIVIFLLKIFSDSTKDLP